MNATSSFLKFVRGWLIFIGLATLGSISPLAADGDAAAVNNTIESLKQAMNGASETDDCVPEDRKKDVPEGHWKGYYRLICEITAPGKPMKMTMKWEGDLEFDVGRHHAPEPPHAPPELRKPLHPPKPAADNGGAVPESVVNAENTAESEIIPAPDTAATGDYYTLYVPPGENGKIAGVATYVNSTTVTVNVGNNHFDQPIHQDSPTQLEALGEEDGIAGFTEIWLWGKQSQFKTTSSMSLSGPDNSMQGQINLDGNGNGTFHATGEHDGHQSDSSGGLAGRPSDPAEQKKKLIHLKLQSTDCWQLSGVVDEQTLKQQFAGQGFNVEVKESEWVAVIDERDVDFEKRVQALAAEPIPNEMTWDYWFRFDSEVAALRESGKRTDYRLCVLRDLDRKWAKVALTGIRTWLDGYPKVSDMNPCAAITVLGAANRRIIALATRLELSGIQCPLLGKWQDLTEAELQKLTKNVLARKHTIEELACLRGAELKGFDFGDTTEAFDKEFTAELSARAKKAGINIDP